jgi:uncharacterized protein YndB with AHSA1/START domain
MGLGAFLARLTAILLVLALLAGGAGFLLPRERTIESKTVILAPPEKVFDFVTDVKGYERWRDDAGGIVVDEGSKPPSWSETASGWQMSFREVKRERPKRFEIEFDSPSGFAGRRTYVFEPTESGDRTNLTRTDVFEIGNPLRRVYSYVAINLQRMINAQMEDLGREFLIDPADAEPTGTDPDDTLPDDLTLPGEPPLVRRPRGTATPTATGSATKPAGSPTGTSALGTPNSRVPVGLPPLSAASSSPTGLLSPTALPSSTVLPSQTVLPSPTISPSQTVLPGPTTTPSPTTPRPTVPSPTASPSPTPARI